MIWDFEEFVNNTAVITDNGDILTYNQLMKESNKVASVVETRCLVFIMCNNEIGSILGYVGFLNNHIVPIMLNSHLDNALLDNLLEKYRPSYLWMPDVEVAEFSSMTKVYSAYGYSLVKTDYKQVYPMHKKLALLLTTSGSTGSPKLVRQSYDNIISNTKSIVNYLELDSNERPITTLPMNYTYGLSIINSHLYVGAMILVTDKSLMQKEFWQFLKLAKATSFGGVPYTYEMLDRIRFTRMNLPYFTTMTQAGGKITPELHKKFAEWAAENGKKFIVMYGQCEATARMGYLSAKDAVRKCGSMGIAIPGGKFHLIDVDGKEIDKPNTTGELVYDGANVTLGYAECGEDLAKGDERHGTLMTGDMARFDNEGFFYIVGRKKRFLKIFGNRVNLDEIDRMIKGHFNVVETACTGVDDHLYIFLTDNKYADEVKKYVSETTRLNSSAFEIKIIDEIPKNDAGKVMYRELEKYMKKEKIRYDF